MITSRCVLFTEDNKEIKSEQLEHIDEEEVEHIGDEEIDDTELEFPDTEIKVEHTADNKWVLSSEFPLATLLINFKIPRSNILIILILLNIFTMF